MAAKADGASVLDVDGGTIQLRHPDASAAVATSDKGQAVYAKALGRRDLGLQLVDGGLEELVTLPDAGAGASYVIEPTLSAGLSARDGEGCVEFVNAAGKVLATIRLHRKSQGHR